MIYIGFILFLFVGLSEAVMDKLLFHYSTSIFGNFKNKLFWNPEVSWKNKYKNGDPNYGEKFFLSTTLFVGLTDGWHLFKLFRNLFIFGGLFFLINGCHTFFQSFILVVIARIIFGLSFSLFFKLFSRST